MATKGNEDKEGTSDIISCEGLSTLGTEIFFLDPQL